MAEMSALHCPDCHTTNTLAAVGSHFTCESQLGFTQSSGAQGKKGKLIITDLLHKISSLVGDSLYRGSVILAGVGTVPLVGDSLYRGSVM